MYEITHLVAPGGLPLDRPTEMRQAETAVPAVRFDDYLIRAGERQRDELRNVERSRQLASESEKHAADAGNDTPEYRPEYAPDRSYGKGDGNSEATRTADSAESVRKVRDHSDRKGDGPANDEPDGRMVDVPSSKKADRKELHLSTGHNHGTDNQPQANDESRNDESRNASVGGATAAVVAEGSSASGEKSSEVADKRNRNVAGLKRKYTADRKKDAASRGTGDAHAQHRVSREIADDGAQSTRSAQVSQNAEVSKGAEATKGADATNGTETTKGAGTATSGTAQESETIGRSATANPDELRRRDAVKSRGEESDQSDRIMAVLKEGGEKKVGRNDRSSDSSDKHKGRDDSLVKEIVVNLSQARNDGETGDSERAGSDFRDLQVRMDATPAGGQDRATNGSVAEATQNLARRLNGSLGDSIVRQAQVIMKDADKGEIRLVIRPPELGRVRIQLQMDQGHIAGRILVDNQNVRQVIEQNLAALQRAFAEAGLEMGEMEVGTGDARQQADRDGRHGADTDSRDRTGEGADQFGRNVRTLGEYDYGNRRVNLVA